MSHDDCEMTAKMIKMPIMMMTATGQKLKMMMMMVKMMGMATMMSFLARI